MQAEVLDRLDGLAACQQPNGKVPSGEEALRALLRGGSPYDWKGAILPGRTRIIPPDVTGCPSLAEVLPADDLRFLGDKSELMLRATEELEGCVSVTPYWDPKLKFNRKAYHQLVLRLHEIGYF